MRGDAQNCNQPSGNPMEPGHEPKKLFHVLQGWPPPGPNYFRWNDGKLVYSVDSQDCAVTPVPSRWAELWRICDEVDIWSWPPDIGDQRVIDGLLFEIEIEIGGRSVRSRGQVVDSPAGFGERLLRVHGAFQSLVGWQPSAVKPLTIAWFRPENEIGIARLKT
jgi:hypothetical protein